MGHGQRCAYSGIKTAVVGNSVQPSEFVLFDQQTGKNEDRPDFQRAWNLARTQKIGGLVCYCVDRAARNVADALALRKGFKKLGVQLQFATQRFDDPPEGNMMFSIYSAFAEYEGQVIIERTNNGRRLKLQSGLLDGGEVPDGFANKKGIIVENPPRAAIWRDIFHWRGVDHLAKYSIASRLNAAGVLTARGC